MKVFGIGLNKTGTTTLGIVFELFGYKHAGNNLDLTRAAKKGDLAMVYEYVEDYDSFEDWPYPLIYQQLDTKFPGSKFILTTRKDSKKWVQSLKIHSLITGPTEYRELVYGFSMPQGREIEHIKFYEDHNQKARQYFQNREKDFLEVCWEKGSGWEELCKFLSKDKPTIPFPHANKSPNQSIILRLRASQILKLKNKQIKSIFSRYKLS